MSKEYMGDSVYVDFDGYYLVLTTENGLGASNTIYIEPPVWKSLVRYHDCLITKRDQAEEKK